MKTLSLWWLSFSGATRNLGVAFIEGETFIAAVHRATLLGLNQRDASITGHVLDPERVSAINMAIYRANMNRVLQLRELQHLFPNEDFRLSGAS